MAEGLVWQVLRENNIVLVKDTLYFYMKMLLEKHEDSYKFMLCHVGRDVFEKFCSAPFRVPSIYFCLGLCR